MWVMRGTRRNAFLLRVQEFGVGACHIPDVLADLITLLDTFNPHSEASQQTKGFCYVSVRTAIRKGYDTAQHR